MATKIYYICDSLTKTRLPGYYMTAKKAVKVAKASEPRLARYFVNDAWLHEFKDENINRIQGVWPLQNNFK